VRDGQAEAAIRVEHIWDDIARTFNVEVVCPYSMTGIRPADPGGLYQRICEEHSVVSSR
jgi:hypothetical protein